jgi:hypothetical protein
MLAKVNKIESAIDPVLTSLEVALPSRPAKAPWSFRPTSL